MEHGGGFHRSEAISAVQDEEQFYGEDDEYDDLYSDVNVGEGFHQTFHGGEDAGGFQARDERRSELPPPPPAPPPTRPAVEPSEMVQIPGIAAEPKIERFSDRSGGFPDPRVTGGGEPVGGARQGALPPPPPPAAAASAGRADQSQSSVRSVQIQGHNGNSSFADEGFQRQGGGYGNEGFQRQGRGGGVVVANGAGDAGGSGGAGVGGTTLFVGELHWWTTDAELETELCKYGQVKEVKFFDERASGKSKGYCQVDFHDPMAAATCKDGMNGHMFNGRPCVVALASPHTVRRMGENQVNKNQQASSQSQPPALAQKGRGGGGPSVGGTFGRGGGGSGGGGGGGGNWGRGGMGNRGPMGNMRNRMGPVGGRGIMGNGGMVAPPPPMLHPGAMLGQGFDPTGYGAAMGRMGAGFGGFPVGATGAPFPGMMPSFPPIVAPHVNPAFFGRGLPPGGIGMWSDPNMGGWGGEEQASYGEDAASDQQYGEGSHGKDRMAERDRYGALDRKAEKDKDMGSGQDWLERRYSDERERDAGRDKEMGRERDRSRERERDRERDRDRDRERDREPDRERDRYRDDRDRHGDRHRHRDREPGRNDNWDRGRSSRPHSKSQDVEHSKRHRPSPE
ncbi:hypothetical protein MUK42_09368 [Musa troglodytarum]|uniref:RRM domain-containing protein n=1 Tax=Musa troglodytarum TaxID=320322 RepID=A0A9E7EA31_9LILI|nr:hypothetical protein MUK42_09368 [Musa troglodytarum]URD73149.1 hypothetical protein MUK42_09368 [Musa troglodytarum]